MSVLYILRGFMNIPRKTILRWNVKKYSALDGSLNSNSKSSL